jgi:hypothetical protein
MALNRIIVDLKIKKLKKKKEKALLNWEALDQFRWIEYHAILFKHPRSSFQNNQHELSHT